ncbi:MAG: nucleotidyl transferase AbiEii/AbiGii toxin family protein [Campylobacterota bacterium]|nr:nucleotidyl transferase AbiEii/AbiGii toxin family protein [Campylobacterota bacterium]
MTANVIEALEKIKESGIFDDELFFVGGTALSYYINHRISEDIDIVSVKALNYKVIVPMISSLGAVKIQDENITALRMAGLFPDEYILKFIIADVKLEFFQANRPIQKEILQAATFSKYKDSKIKILDLKSICKLKLVALLQRDKSRDLFDFIAILNNKILTIEEILDVTLKTSNIKSINELYTFIKSKKEPLNDETVYLSEKNSINLLFNQIKSECLLKLENGH